MAQSLGALGQASPSYGIITKKEAMATIVPLMDAIQAHYYAKVIMDMFMRDLSCLLKK